MNIAIFYEYSPDEKWSTPLSLIHGFRELKHNIQRFQLSKEGAIKYQQSDIPFDIAIQMDWKGFMFDHFNPAFHPGTFRVAEFGDCPQNFDKHLLNAKHFDLILSPDYPSTEKLKNLGYNAVWWNHFADTNIHYPVTNKDDEYPQNIRSTRGKGGSPLMDYLTSVMPDKFLNKNGMLGREYGSFLASGLITLQQSRWQEITRRLFEGMACGSLVITDRLPEHTHINDLFIENEDIVYYDDIPECISKLNYYLNNEQERARIAKNGYEKVMNQHTQLNRAEAILNEHKKFIE